MTVPDYPNDTDDRVADGEPQQKQPVDVEQFLVQLPRSVAAQGLYHAALDDDGDVRIQKRRVVEPYVRDEPETVVGGDGDPVAHENDDWREQDRVAGVYP